MSNCSGEGLAEFQTAWANREKSILDFAETSGTFFRGNEEDLKTKETFQTIIKHRS